MALTPGIHKISEEEYHSDPCEEISLSRGIIKTLLYRSPAHAFIEHPKLNPNYQPDTGDKKFDKGNAAHQILLEGIDNVEVIDADDWRKKEAKEKRDEARSIGKIPLLTKQYDETIVMVERALVQIEHCKELGIKDFYKDGDAELTMVWTETDDIGRKSWHRIRPDWISNDRSLILDYKTTGTSADPNEFSAQIARMGYDIQDSYYSRGSLAVTGVKPKFIFVVQETEEPYLCSFIGLNPYFQDMGKQKTDYCIFMWNQCMQNNDWPGYPDKVCWCEPPVWAITQWESKAMDIGL